MKIYVDDKFRVNIFLDTNILVDILDNTFVNLNKSVDYLIDSDFVDLKSSHYNMFEFVEVRKRLLFIKEIQKTQGVNIPIKSSFGRRGNWKHGDIKYEDYKDPIVQTVTEEKLKISSEYSIDWENNTFHEELLAPTVDLCLGSTISREDSLVMTTCAFPRNGIKEGYVLLMSRDKNFNDSCKDEINSIFESYKLSMPEMLKTGCLINRESRRQLNLYDDQETEDDIVQFWIDKIKKTIIQKNKNIYLGMTYYFPLERDDKSIFFNLKKDVPLNCNICLTIIGKNLDFIFSTKFIGDFWNFQSIKNYPFVNIENEEHISFRLADNIDDELFRSIRQKGNLVFVNTDV